MLHPPQITPNIITNLSSRSSSSSSMMIPSRKQYPVITILVILLCGMSGLGQAFHFQSAVKMAPRKTSQPMTAASHSLPRWKGSNDQQSSLPSTTNTALSMVSPLFHMGHSHAHHDHHDEEEEEDPYLASLSPKQKAQTLRRRRRRRVALMLFCALATLGPKLIKGAIQKRQGFVGSVAKLSQGDWLAFGLSILAISSADKMKRSLLDYFKKLRGLGDAIAKHQQIPDQAVSALASAAASGSSSSSSTAPDTSAADRVTWIGVVINILLSVGKLTVGITQHSSVLIADAGHSLSDLVSDFITLLSVRIARLPPDEDHPYGHTKFEAIGSLFLSLTLLATGVSVAAMAHRQLMPFLSTWGNSAASAAAKASVAAIPAPGPLALVMAGISIASKEWLYRITKTVGERLHSPVVVANAWHHRSDAYSSVLALLSIALAISGYAAADAAAGLLVAGMIGLTGFDIFVQSIQQLSDSAHLGLQRDLHALVTKWIERDPDVWKITSVRARQVGSSAFCDVTVETSPELSTTATRAVEERLKRYLVPALSAQTGQWITATVHAKPPLLVCPLLEAAETTAATTTTTSEPTTTNNMDDTTTSTTGMEDELFVPAAAPPLAELSSSQVEHLVFQQALLLNHAPTSSSTSTDDDDSQDDSQQNQYQVQGVTVHYQSPRRVSVDVTIHPSEEGTMDLSQLQGAAQTLQTALQDQVSEIQSARIYLDLLPTTGATTLFDDPVAVLPTTTSATATATVWNGGGGAGAATATNSTTTVTTAN